MDGIINSVLEDVSLNSRSHGFSWYAIRYWGLILAELEARDTNVCHVALIPGQCFRRAQPPSLPLM